MTKTEHKVKRGKLGSIKQVGILCWSEWNRLDCKQRAYVLQPASDSGSQEKDAWDTATAQQHSYCVLNLCVLANHVVKTLHKPRKFQSSVDTCPRGFWMPGSMRGHNRKLNRAQEQKLSFQK